jgi:hypothetical protein
MLLKDEVIEIYDPLSGDQIQHYQTIGKVLNGEKWVEKTHSFCYIVFKTIELILQ